MCTGAELINTDEEAVKCVAILRAEGCELQGGPKKGHV